MKTQFTEQTNASIGRLGDIISIRMISNLKKSTPGLFSFSRSLKIYVLFILFAIGYGPANSQVPREIQPRGPEADENLWESPWTAGGAIVIIVVVILLYRWRRNLLRKRDEEK